MSQINFIEVDAQKIQSELIDDYQNAVGEVLYPGDERRIFLLQQTPVLVSLKNEMNYIGNQNLLPYAKGEAIDALGQLVGVTRLPAQQAITTLRFTLSAAQVNDITIPAGIRVTPDDVIYFATVSDLIIAAGQTTGTVGSRSTLAGSKYNGFIPGQIKIIVDPVPYVASVSNIDTSYDGADIESDDGVRERIQIVPESYSVAGPSSGYVYWAKTADINIEDVSVNSSSPGVVDLYVLMKSGQLPTQEILDKVFAIVNARDKRPLTDNVIVHSALANNYDINLTYYISQARQSEEKVIRELVEGEGGVVDQYIQWQYAEVGRDITPDYLLSLLYTAGAFRVVITAPVFTELTFDNVAILNIKSISYGGLI